MKSNTHLVRCNHTMPSTAHLTAFCGEGRLKETLHILLTAHKPPLHSSTYLQLLHTCIAKNALSEGKLIHSFITDSRFTFATRPFFQNKLIKMYAKCGSLMDARKIFDDMAERDVSSWNTIIAAYRKHRYPREALTLFRQMQPTGVQPDHFTFASILPACAKLGAVEEGMNIHQSVMESGFLSDDVVANALIDMYAKCGNIEKAWEVFDKMPQRTVVSWTAMITGYAQCGFAGKALETFKQMLLTGVKPDSTTFSSILPACAKLGALEEGMDLHQSLIESGFLSDVVVGNSLIDMYAKCGSIQKAQELFNKMARRNVVSWTAMIAGYAQNRLAEKALETFKQMQLAGVNPNSTTFASILPACAKLGALKHGMHIHQSIIESGVLSDVVVVSALIDMYAKCGSIQKARDLFDKMPQRNMVSWTAMIAGYAENDALDDALRLFEQMPESDVVSWTVIIGGYAQNGLAEKALQTFKQMQLLGVKPNPTTFASILPTFAKMGALKQSMDIHESIIESGFASHVEVASALIDLYAKCGSIWKAQRLFDKMPHKNVVSWNTMIVGYSQNGLVGKALETFKKMQAAGVKPDCITFPSVLSACAKMGALEEGMDIHQSIIENGFLADVVVSSALIDMYAKCGSIQKALELFDKLPQRNVVSWTAMIAGYAMHGYGKDALKLFEQMKHSGTYPDHVSFVCVLFACSHAGLVDEGCKYFNGMSNSYCIMPIMDHYVCMVDLLGRAGYLEEALNLIIKMPTKPVVVVWMCLLGICRSHKNIELGSFTATVLSELDPKNAAPYVLLLDIYADTGRWGDIRKLRRLMKDRVIKKIPGCSWIEVHKMVHAFCVGDRSHPQTQEIYAKLENLSLEMKALGYFPNSRYIPNDLEDEEKELVHYNHSEMLAISF